MSKSDRCLLTVRNSILYSVCEMVMLESGKFVACGGEIV